jgi:hypothetical protein
LACWVAPWSLCKQFAASSSAKARIAHSFSKGRIEKVLLFLLRGPQKRLNHPAPKPHGKPMDLRLQPTTSADASTLADLHASVAEHLTSLHGIGPWSMKSSEMGVLFAMRTSKAFVARQRTDVMATLRLATKKPCAIDTSYFAPCRKPPYLVAIDKEWRPGRPGVSGCFRRQMSHL